MPWILSKKIFRWKNFRVLKIIHNFAWKNFRVSLILNFQRQKLLRKWPKNANNEKVSALKVLLLKDKLICLHDIIVGHNHVDFNFTSKKKQGPIKLLKTKTGTLNRAELKGAMQNYLAANFFILFSNKECQNFTYKQGTLKIDKVPWYKRLWKKIILNGKRKRYTLSSSYVKKNTWKLDIELELATKTALM